jgi:hypothetical protein
MPALKAFLFAEKYKFFWSKYPFNRTNYRCVINRHTGSDPKAVGLTSL